LYIKTWYCHYDMMHNLISCVDSQVRNFSSKFVYIRCRHIWVDDTLSNQNSRPHAQTRFMEWKSSHALRSSVNKWECNMNILIFSRPSRNTFRRHKGTRGRASGDPCSVRPKCLETNVTQRLSESEGKN
jgi:hypothetical protein